MTKIFVAPADGTQDQKDLERSVANPVERKLVIANFSDATYPELIDIERRGRGFYAWGLPAGSDNVEKWFQMGVGDFVLISYKGAYRHYAKVLGRYNNARAARAVWGGEDEDGARELMFFLTEPVLISLELSELNDYLPAEYDEFVQIDHETVDRVEADFRTIERFFRRRLLNTGAGGPMLDMSGIIQITEREQTRLHAFDPENSKDGRARVVEAVTRRRGHPTLRQNLLAAYERQCAVTGFNATDTLEVTYIIPFRGKYTHHPSNGILLRADLHTLFDLGKIAVDTRTMTIILADDLRDSSYRILAGRPLRYPKEESQRPSTEGLDLHRRLVGL